MRLPLDQVLVNVDDTPATDEKGQPVTLRSALIRAILTDIDGEGAPVKGEAKLRRYDLYRAIKKASDETDFTPEDVVDMRKAILIYPPLTCGQMRDLLT